MKQKKMIIALSVGMFLLLGGCFNLDSSNSKGQKLNTSAAKQTKDYYVSVQDYTGEGYALPNGERTDKIAKAHHDEIEKAVKKYFKEKYKTDVTVHNVVGAVDGASVFVESVGELHFYTYAIVPIDVQNKKVKLDEVWSQEGQVEKSIQTGLYRLVNEEAFQHLEDYTRNIIKDYPLVGLRKEAFEKTKATGYMTPYYYVDVADKSMERLYNEFMQNPNITKSQLKSVYKTEKIEPKKIFITIRLFMKESGVKPDKVLFDKICKDIENETEFPKGSYNILLYNNLIQKRTGMGSDEGLLDRGFPNSIIKE